MAARVGAGAVRRSPVKADVADVTVDKVDAQGARGAVKAGVDMFG